LEVSSEGWISSPFGAWGLGKTSTDKSCGVEVEGSDCIV
jgi:hypothetical protein